MTTVGVDDWDICTVTLESRSGVDDRESVCFFHVQCGRQAGHSGPHWARLPDGQEVAWPVDTERQR